MLPQSLPKAHLVIEVVFCYAFAMKIENKILILGGTHGNEKTGVSVVKSLQRKEYKNLEALIANPKAVEKNLRFIEADLNRNFDLPGKTYEHKLAKSLKKTFKKSGFIIEFHNTKSKSNDCGIIVTKPNKAHINLAKYFKLNKVLIMPRKGSVSSFNPDNFFSIELERNSKIYTVKYIMEKLSALELPFPTQNGLADLFEFTGKTFYKKDLARANVDIQKLTNFKAFNKSDKKKLGLSLDLIYVPIFIGEYGKDFGFHVALFKGQR
ncbi:MAG: aspartoacylase [Candidatus Doudnabacteria bacterium]|nr:aspartoacylase [Candidatus Doudnabacteria bacterium]